MKSLIAMLMIAFTLSIATLGSFPALAQEPPVTPVVEVLPSPTPGPEISDGALLQSTADAIKQIGQVTKQEGLGKQAVVVTIIMIIAQLLIQATKAPLFGRTFKNVNAKGKLAIVSVLTILTTIAPLMLNGVSFLASLSSGVVLSALMVAGHQVYEAFIKKDAVA